MSQLVGLLRRNYRATVSPPVATKSDQALHFGILGAANVAPYAFISPAKSHPEVVIQAVAARDRAKATAYAAKHGIHEVKDSYQAILDDPKIDCVYIPLPNGLHYEWAIKALEAGKHVLVEKPSVSNSKEAELLFNSPLLKEPNSPVILEAFHYRFQPHWQFFLTLLDQPNIELAHTSGFVPSIIFGKDDIRFQFSLAGGALMDLGAYGVSALRQTFGVEPEECLEANFNIMPGTEGKIEHGWNVKWRMANGGTAISEGSLQAKLTQFGAPRVAVTHRQSKVEEEGLPSGQEKWVIRKVVLFNFMVGTFWHRIDVEDNFELRESETGKVVKKWTEKTSRKAYTFKEAGLEGPGEDWWMSYRHQLEQFVNRVKGRETRTWVASEDSIAQMRMIDMAYEKGGLPIRPSKQDVDGK
ncbi:unnamed protein product [Clonostachys rhizophaga]|uniref:D-xylose 1-dehydrogenase (NADP(+), D-xylono-1,5-lactone-forming) n=1 Tax=Clonostachys rhizophaga TaxID=160324 RepID=A0A9N9YJP7_9HYPO|nr:unnamed protein product [Clonostachys rhizophaga]